MGNLNGHENRVSCLGVSNDGMSLCTGSWDSTVSQDALRTSKAIHLTNVRDSSRFGRGRFPPAAVSESCIGTERPDWHVKQIHRTTFNQEMAAS